MSKEKKIHIVKSVIKHGLLLCVGFFWIYPFLWMISASFKGQNEFFQNRMGLIPVQPTIDNFIRIWQKADFGTYFINTIIVTAFSVIIVLIMTMMAGYAMGRYKFLGRNLCMAVFLASIATILAKLYLKYRNLDTLQGILYSLRPAVVSMIASAGVLILVTAFWGSGIINIDGIKWDMVLIFAISVVLLRKTKWNPVFVMILAGVLKVLVALI